ncbi:class I SAM-dependent methyltransferase [Planococcus sp. SE5232]|uniref:class I SAM-dependent methyltransferase n=1 Tax=unclassified Planococcus (in: firmicutes) TaxID=2662419 RepID=UPI003D6AA8DC
MPSEHVKSHGTAHQHGKVSYLESAKRKADFSPEQLLNRIPLKSTDHILDFGAGTGYFTIPAAKRVDGQVFALDTDQAMLEMISQKAAKEQLANIVPIQGGNTGIPIPDASMDVVIASLVLHEIHPLAATLTQIKDVLKNDGYVIVIELEPKGQSTHKAPRISIAGMEEELEAAGLHMTEKFFPTESLYVLIAQKHAF